MWKPARRDLAESILGLLVLVCETCTHMPQCVEPFYNSTGDVSEKKQCSLDKQNEALACFGLYEQSGYLE